MGNVRQRRIAIAIVFASLALSALFLAQGTTALLASAIFRLDPSVVEQAGNRRTAPGAGGSTVGTQADSTNILTRNIFDSQTGNILAQQEPEPEETVEDEVVLDPNAPPPPCDGSVRLVGSLVNTRYPEWSFAAIVGPAGKALLYRAGMSIEGRQLLAVGPSLVYLRPSDGNVCSLAMFNPEAPEGPSRAAAAATPATPRAVVRRGSNDDEGSIDSAELEQGITRVSDTNYNVSRDLVNNLLENQAELMRTARIIPHQENGRTVGVKMYGIRRNSLLGRLGMQNGDMLRTINGYDMTSPDSALEAYSRLREANHLTVSVVRRGQAMNIDYNIQ